MRYRLLGRSGLRVSEMGLGTMTFGEEWGWGASKEESRRIFDAFVEAGGNFIDTANGYTNGTSETFVGEFVGKERDRFVVATKYTVSRRPSDPNGGGNHRKNLLHSLEASLRRLRTDYIDLYWVHAFDGVTPVDEVMRALDDMVRSGKVLYLGVSDHPAWVVSRANTLAELRGWSQFAGLQIEYSLVQRTPERDLLPMARALEIGVTTWGILGSGVLSSKFLGGGGKPEAKEARLAGAWGAAYLTERNTRIAEAVAAVARELGVTASQVAVAWVRHQQHGRLIPLVGARRLGQFQDNLGALKVELGPEHLARLDEVSRVELGFPHDFLERPFIQQLIHGETYPLLERPRR